MSSEHFRIAAIDCYPLSAAIDQPVRNSWRTLTSRSALVLRITTADGAEGWGEVWCNYPPRGSLHRADLVDHVIAPLVIGRDFDSPTAMHRFLAGALRIPAIQSGEPGPFAQAAAGLDNAAWDLVARRAGEPLWRYLGGVSQVKVYASGLSPDDPGPIAAEARRNGFRVAKLKVGADAAVDARNARAVLDALGAGGRITFDANQRWTPDVAADATNALAAFDPLWMEEPIRADESIATWQALARATRVPLAAGENLRGADFDAYLDSGAIRHVQPDIGKWGGYSACLPLARKAAALGIEFCPHWLGGAVGLLASLHILAGTGGRGWGEYDANPNKLREDFMPADITIADSLLQLSDAPGVGIAPDPALLQTYTIKRT